MNTGKSEQHENNNVCGHDEFCSKNRVEMRKEREIIKIFGKKKKKGIQKNNNDHRKKINEKK